MQSQNRHGVDRRFDGDNRKIYDLNYFINGGVERRGGIERRKPGERRIGWVKRDDWQSVYLGNLICADDLNYKENIHLAHRSKIARNVKKYKEHRKNRRFWIQQHAYAVLRPASRRIGQIVDISRGGLSFCHPDTGESHDANAYHLDIFMVGDGFYLDKVPFKIVSERKIDIELPDMSIQMKQCGVQFDRLTMDQIERLDIVIEKYTKRQVR